MKAYLFKRLLHLIPVFLGVSVVTFTLIHLAPGDPAYYMLQKAGVEPTKEALQALRHDMGLNLPIWQQYLRWCGQILQLNLGISIKTGDTVVKELLDRLPATLELAGASLVMIILIAFPLGIFSAMYQGGWLDRLSRGVTVVSLAMPQFWLGLLLIYFFAVKIHLLPASGRGDIDHLILPAFTLSLGMAFKYARLLRTSLLEVLSQEYVRAARARGVKPLRLVTHYGLNNALVPILATFGMSFGQLLGGSVIIETVFSWPGIGKFAMESIMNRDYMVVQGYALLMALIFVLVNLCLDIACMLLDPKTKIYNFTRQRVENEP